MKTLLIGTNGFIGKALASELKKNCDLTLFTSSHVSEFKIQHVQGDLLHLETIEALKKMKFERVIDASWIGLPNLTKANNEINYVAKINLIKALKSMEVSEYIGFGSCLEYGSATGCIKENHLGVNVGGFGETKRIILASIAETGINYKWFRPFYLVGANQHENSLLKSAVRSYEKRIDFRSKNPSASFDFIPLEDAVSMMVTILTNDVTTGIFNIGSGKTRTVNQLINLVRKFYGRDEIEIKPSEGMYASLEKVRTQVGFESLDNFDDSINRIITQIRSQ